MEEHLAGSPYYRCSTLLILTGDGLEPDDVTRQLQLEPWQSWRKGDKRYFDSGGEHVYIWSGWKRKMNEEWDQLNLEEQLRQWYELLYPKRKILYDFANQDYIVRLDCLLLPYKDSVTTVVLD